ncbi:MAG TPA: hypothetical protein VJR89_37840 [Polyangiales bacterium]|nr:hypothetical protein [Polyangiales bacterium]
MILRILALSLTAVLLGAAGFAAHYEVVYRDQAHSLDEDVAALRRLHWERPVLRGVAGDGNAAAELYAALPGFAPLSPELRSSLAERLHYGQPPGESEAHQLELRKGTLKALRAATQQGWAFTELAVERADDMRIPDYPQIVDAGLCLLADARRAAPAECLRVAADVIRMGQDLVPGAPLAAASTSARLTSLASKLVTRCAADADLATLRRAVHEFNVLATHPPPTGAGIELSDLVSSMKMRKALALTDKESPGGVWATLLSRPQLLPVWALFDRPARFRKLSPENYPDATVEWRHEQDYRAKSDLPLSAADERDVLDRLHDDMRGQALLRMLTVGLATLADKAYRGKLPARPTTIDEPALADPYRGAPFNYRIANDGSELTLWSIGEDYKDDNGSSEWTESAPVDVVLHIQLSKPQPRSL